MARKHPSLRKIPTPAVVDAAWSDFQAAIKHPEVNHGKAAARMLDRIGFEGLDVPDAVKRVIPAAAEHLTDAFAFPESEFGSPEAGQRAVEALSVEMINRIAVVDPRRYRRDDVKHSIALTWLATCLRRIILAFPPGAEGEEFFAQVLEMPLVKFADPELVSPAHLAIVRHPGCPPEFLREACMNLEIDVARAAAEHPQCPEDGQVAVVLRDSSLLSL